MHQLEGIDYFAPALCACHGFYLREVPITLEHTVPPPASIQGQLLLHSNTFHHCSFYYTQTLCRHSFYSKVACIPGNTYFISIIANHSLPTYTHLDYSATSLNIRFALCTFLVSFSLLYFLSDLLLYTWPNHQRHCWNNKYTGVLAERTVLCFPIYCLELSYKTLMGEWVGLAVTQKYYNLQHWWYYWDVLLINTRPHRNEC